MGIRLLAWTKSTRPTNDDGLIRLKPLLLRFANLGFFRFSGWNFQNFLVNICASHIFGPDYIVQLVNFRDLLLDCNTGLGRKRQI